MAERGWWHALPAPPPREDERPPRRWRCGFGGQPKCEVFLEERGLCPDHQRLIKESLHAPEPPPAKSRPTPPKRHITTAAEREDAARKIAEYVCEHPKTNGDPVCQKLGIKRSSRLFRHAINIALERGWIVSHGRAGYSPGPNAQSAPKVA